jgi:hypothetical protein
MSKVQTYRLQIHCSRSMHSQICELAKRRGLSQSGAARVLIDRALSAHDDEVSNRFATVESYLEAVLHAASVNRILSTELIQKMGDSLTVDDLRERTTRIMDRYKSEIIKQ